MAEQIDGDELLAAWRALAGELPGEGWRTIQIRSDSSWHLRAGRHFPGNAEALLVGFTSEPLDPEYALSKSRGFSVSRTDLGNDSVSRTWIAIRREPSGKLDLFLAMVVDVVQALLNASPKDDRQARQAFFLRIIAWQEFMRQSDDGVLSEQAIIGLTGELHLLQQLIDANVPTSTAVNAWQGPSGATHDFRFAAGAIEVKSTLAVYGFPVDISSLDQLDDSNVQPLYLTAYRFLRREAGSSLPELVAQLRVRFNGDPHALDRLNEGLLKTGYHDSLAGRYTGRFALEESKALRVSSSDFPRLTRHTIPAAINEASYTIDLSRVHGCNVAFPEIVATLGVV